MSDIQVNPLVTSPPRILASSHLTRISPRHAATASLSTDKQLDRQIAHSQMRVQYRRTLPLTQQDFYLQRQKPSPNQ
jgi:hypothetical protein